MANKDIGANIVPLDTALLSVPESGETARAGDVEAIAQRMLDNDAALARAFSGLEGLDTFHGVSISVTGEIVDPEFPYPEMIDQDQSFTGVVPELTGAWLLKTAYFAHSGRLRLYPSQAAMLADPANRNPETTPPAVDILLDVAIAPAGGTVELDRPLVLCTDGGGVLPVWYRYDYQGPSETVNYSDVVLSVAKVANGSAGGG